MVIRAKEIAHIGVTVALLIGGQLALSAVGGVEIVTAVFAVYCLVFGVIRGFLVATAFSLVRCFVFGFFPQVIILYLIYYNLFALVVGLLGGLLRRRKDWVQLIALTLVVALLTGCFTLIDNLLNILIFKMNLTVAKIYFAQSIPIALSQIACAIITVPLFYYPLSRIFLKIKQKV